MKSKKELSGIKKKFEISQFIKDRSSLDDHPQSSDSNSSNKKKKKK